MLDDSVTVFELMTRARCKMVLSAANHNPEELAKPSQYRRTIEWLRDLVYSTEFEADRIRVAAQRMIGNSAWVWHFCAMSGSFGWVSNLHPDQFDYLPVLQFILIQIQNHADSSSIFSNRNSCVATATRWPRSCPTR
jgi:hypothetical protein